MDGRLDEGRSGAMARTNGSRRGAWPRASALAAAALVLAGGTALGAVRIGTDGDETLVGTHKADRLEGKGGTDLLKGLAGNDRYVFGNGWGTDRLVEKAVYTVDGTTRPGGADTLDFSRVTAGRVEVYLVPEGGTYSNVAVGGDGDMVILGASPVENVVGGAFKGSFDAQSFDFLTGGAGPNTIDSGGGGDDDLGDIGGTLGDPSFGIPELPPSDDTYRGLARNAGIVNVWDWGGADTVDLRPLRSDEVAESPFDLDGDGVHESLLIVADNVSVVLVGHLDDFEWVRNSRYEGRIETVLYEDGPVEPGAGSQAMVASADADRTEGVRAAERRVAEAWRSIRDDGRLGGGGRG